LQGPLLPDLPGDLLRIVPETGGLWGIEEQEDSIEEEGDL
jgi:hypothetical protein